ncbi:MAG: PhoX family protein, partial [Gammaproteobacteria bacterium]
MTDSNPRRDARQPTDFETLADRALKRGQDLGQQRGLSRRTFLGGVAQFGASALVLGFGGLGFDAVGGRAAHAGSGASNAGVNTDAPHWLSFEPVAANSADTITVPPGFRWRTVISWGDPLWSKGSPFDPSSRGDANSQALAFGDNNDGMSLFTHEGRSILVVNNEYVNLDIIHGNRASRRPENADDIRKNKAAHGVSVVEIKQENGAWEPVPDSPFNRRITADTPMDITGPGRGHDLLKTEADPKGTRSLGTWNNCGNGETPWGTYLACEENFNGYFASSDPDHSPSAALERYGVTARDRGYGWYREDARFDISLHPNEPNRAGYVVEIDPLDPAAMPKKRTALGRFKHENAEVVIADSGHVVVYLGDDERGEYLYRFVSRGKYSENGDNRDLLADGQLYAAHFNDDGTGTWLALTPEATGMASQAEICIHTRLAASAVKATTMDRPEWVAAHPHKAEGYC